MLRFQTCIIILLVLVFPLLLIASDSVAGKWKGTSKNGDNTLEFTLDLKQEGEKVTGTIEVNYNSVEIEGTFKQGQLEFIIDAGDTKYTATASLQTNKLEGKWKNDRGEEGTWSAEKE